MLSVPEADGRAPIRNEGRKKKALSMVYSIHVLIYQSLKLERSGPFMLKYIRT